MGLDGDGVRSTSGDHSKRGSYTQIFNKPGNLVCSIKYCVYFPANHVHQIKVGNIE